MVVSMSWWNAKCVLTCFVGGGPLGHPKIFINLVSLFRVWSGIILKFVQDKPGPQPCGYVHRS
jgi:hypothetical protein